MNIEKESYKAQWIQKTVQAFIVNSNTNTLQNQGGDKAFETSLVGFSSGADPLYESFKDHVGPFYLTPWELFAVTFKDFSIQLEELTVICWIPPYYKADNCRQDFYPAEEWARGRILGEETNVRLRKHVIACLQEKGFEAVALAPQISIRISPRYGYASTWSERHAAYASGLGTFGLCNGLITPVGKAMRVGSVIAQISVPPTKRPYTDPHAYCLFYTQGDCGKCISRCRVGAVTEAGKNKELCYDHLFPVTQDYVKTNYAFDEYGGGLCQTGAPCESKIPLKVDL